MPLRVAIDYVTAATSIADDARLQYTAAGCQGSELTRYAFHTLTPGQAPSTEIDAPDGRAVSLRWTVTGRSSGGSIHMRFRTSLIGDFTDSLTVFDGVVVYTTAVASGSVCINLPAELPGNCQYGTRPRLGTDAFINVTPNFVANAAAERGMVWLAALLVATYFLVLDVTDLCTHPPPDLDPIPGTGFQADVQRALVALKWLVWPLLCECTPGTPPPTPFPAPTQPQPPGLPAPPVFVVTEPGDPAALEAILRRLSEIQNTVNQDLVTDNLLQRWRLPFGTILGELHEHLTESGSIPVARAVGALITVTTLPTDPSTVLGNPIYIKDLGWIAADDGGAMLQEVRITRQQQAWYPQQMQLATRLSWALRDGVEIAVQELLPEP